MHSSKDVLEQVNGMYSIHHDSTAQRSTVYRCADR
jgi:hypothetical protein